MSVALPIVSTEFWARSSCIQGQTLIKPCHNYLSLTGPTEWTAFEGMERVVSLKTLTEWNPYGLR